MPQQMEENDIEQNTNCLQVYPCDLHICDEEYYVETNDDEVNGAIEHTTKS